MIAHLISTLEAVKILKRKITKLRGFNNYNVEYLKVLTSRFQGRIHFSLL